MYIAKNEGLKVGMELFRNHDHAFARQLDGSRMRRRIAAYAVVEISSTRISLAVTDESGLAVRVERDGVFEPARDAQKMSAVVRDEIARSGDTVFDIQQVTIDGEPLFVPVSALAQLRRQALMELLEARIALPPERNPAIEDTTAQAPRGHLEGDANVTNRLAERFWRDHGVVQIDSPIELRGPHAGDPIMRTRYCIRREIGQCLREKGTQSTLFLVRGTTRFALDFDCANCEMIIRKI